MCVVTGVIAVAAIAPNLLHVVGKMSRYGYENVDRKKRFENRTKDLVKSIYYLKRYKYVQLAQEGDEFIMKVTKKGEDKIRRMNFKTLQVPRTARFFKHWWFVLADVPSKPYRHQADLFREKLKQMDFYPLQRTVWVFPFNPIDQVEFISVYYGIEQFVTVLEAAKVDRDDEEKLNKFFKEKEVF